MNDAEAGASRSEAGDYVAARKLLSRLLREGMSWSGRERNCTFLNTGGSRFATISTISGLDFPEDGRALAASDWDHDGDVDLWLLNRTSPQLRLMLNQGTDGNRSIAIRLHGRTVNRDAVGARLELHVTDHDRPLLRTVRAGDGFLSQSSPWVHFGLGGASRVDGLTVRWPGGPAEEISGVEAQGRYLVVEGEGKAVAWERPAKPQLAPSEQVIPAQTDQGRVFLAAPVPAPLIPYHTFDGTRADAPRGRPVLVNLWASWCAPCVMELTQFTEQADAIRGQGLEILALSLDGLGAEEMTSPDDARALLERIGYPFESGVASTRLLDVFERLQSRVISKPKPLPVPTSFLIDSNGLLAAIYRGPVLLEQLLSDVAALEMAGDERFKRAIQVAGRKHKFGWPKLFDVVDDIARTYEDGGHDDQALAVYEAVVRMKPGLAEAQERYGTALADRNRLEEASRYFEEALRLDPDNEPARIGLGRVMVYQGRPDDAIDRFREILAGDPDNAAAHLNLALALARMGETDESIEHYSETLRLVPDNVTALNNLALALARKGDDTEAIRLCRLALKLEPDNAITHANLGLALFRKKEHAAAIPHLREAIRLNPGKADIHYRLGLCLMAEDQRAEAITALSEALKLRPDMPRAAGELAWILATHPDGKLRNGDRAVALMQAVRDKSPDERVEILDVLAAAYAEVGEFESSVETARLAARIARERGAYDYALRIEDRLSLYQSAQPYRAVDPADR